MIHAGPHKTGTTSLQREILRLASELKHDRFAVPENEFPGRFQGEEKVVANLAISIQDDKSCVDEFGKVACTTEFNQAYQPGIQFVESAWRRNYSVFLSSEEFDKPLNSSKFKSLLPPSGRVEIILVYRTIGEWLRSLYSQMLRQFNTNDVISFVEWLRRVIIPNLPSYAHQLQVSQVARRFLNMNITGLSIKILKYKRTGTLGTEIFCDILKSNHACEQSRLDSSMTTDLANARIDSGLYLFLTEAKKRGILPRNVSHYSSISLHQVETYYNPKKKSRDLTHDCLEPNFLEMLRTHAKNEMFYLERVSNLSKEFTWEDDVLNDNVICAPNVFELFMEDEWVDILKVLDVNLLS